MKGAMPDKYRERSQIELDAKVQATGAITLYIPDNGRDGNEGD